MFDPITDGLFLKNFTLQSCIDMVGVAGTRDVSDRFTLPANFRDKEVVFIKRESVSVSGICQVQIVPVAAEWPALNNLYWFKGKPDFRLVKLMEVFESY